MATKKMEGIFHCPGCGESVILRRGQQKVPHFAHRKGTCQTFAEGETSEHLQGKLLLQSCLPPEARLEAFLPELQQRPDLLWGKVALEFQCSPLPFERFLQRTQGYLVHGYRPFWILGQRFFPKGQLSLFQKACCFYLRGQLVLLALDTQESQLCCYRNLQWHYQQGITYHCECLEVGTQLGQKILMMEPVTAQQPWSPTDFRHQLTKGLVNLQPNLLHLQEICYLAGGHLLELPDWCYQPSEFFFFFQQELLVLRFLFVCEPKPSLLSWLQRLRKLNKKWAFPLVNQKQLLIGVFVECQRLAEE